ncbi:hypothetical protein [Streptomyces macrosporus]|uniref:Lipoprotein n=1 Tax=Streptomyces macrosporus TaxID=44032 RepID=A0ABN3KHA2_9ACTN
MRTRHTAAIAATMLLALTTACTGSDDTADTKTEPAKVPPYEIVQQDDSGNQREIVVEVDSTKGLKTIFEDVAKDLTEEAGYFITINCASGGSDAADNRLANGRKAVGAMGAAATGMDEGATEYEPVKGATCP